MKRPQRDDGDSPKTTARKVNPHHVAIMESIDYLEEVSYMAERLRAGIMGQDTVMSEEVVDRERATLYETLERSPNMIRELSTKISETLGEIERSLFNK